jgi:hypothetical protein
VHIQSGAAWLVLNSSQSGAAKTGFSRNKVITLLFTPVVFKGISLLPNGDVTEIV